MTEIRGKAIRSLRRLNDEERILLMARYVDHIRGFENIMMEKLGIERDALKKQLEAIGVKACDLQPVSVEMQKA